ncbi:DNA replication factor Cdt1 [Ambystoma mexicanum]|uniref:DNA replication factor Cdt1 n=1 Tax=Ambystoma mexicanum TaxID=8296 RepID=UPI0037E83FA2
MAQLRMTDYFAQTKVGSPSNAGPLSAKRRKVRAEQQLQATLSPPRKLALSLPRTPPGSDPPALVTPKASASRKKRPRPESDGDQPPGDVKRSARKKLILSAGEGAVATELVATPSPSAAVQPLTPSSLDKNGKNLMNGILSPSLKRTSPWQEDLNFLDVKTEPTSKQSELNIRMQRIQEITQKLNLPTKPASASANKSVLTPVKNTSDLKSLQKQLQRLKVRQRHNVQKEVEESKVADSTEKKDGRSEEGAAPEKAPAYQRFHALAQDVPPGLSLPYKYKVLAEMFRSMDTIVGMLFNRSETVTFAKVKQGVQDMMRKPFVESNIGQIKAVYPTAYRFRQENNIPTYKDGVKKSDYQLTIEPLVDEGKINGPPQLSASCQLERRRVFGNNLVNIVKQHHRVFLESLDPRLLAVDECITRWHPRFNVDTVPDIIPAELPLSPRIDKINTAQEVLNKARGMMTPKMEKALANLALRSVEGGLTEQKEAEDSVKPSPLTAVPCSLKGVPQSLLERIRAKEALKMQAIMTRNPQQEERLSMMSRLPDMARILRNVFVAEKKPALTMEVACNRVIASYRSSMTQREMERHLRLLSELVPSWLGIHAVRKDIYLKLDKAVELALVQEALAKKIKVEEGL